MKKLYILIFALLAANICMAQPELKPVPGGLELQSREVLRPDLTGYSFYETMKQGYYSQDRALEWDSLNMTFKGNWPLGQSLSMTYTGVDEIFLVGSGGGVLLVDVADPENPVVISTIKARALVDASYYDPETSRLYLGAYFSGVEIWDLSDMENPSFLARIPTNSYPRGGVFAGGDFVYVMTVADGVYVFDVSDINNIEQTGHYGISSSTLVWNAAMDGDYLYCACSSGGCRVVDVSDPYDPKIAGIAGGYTTGVCVSGGKLYTVASSTGLRVFDVTDPTSPQMLGSLSLEGNPEKVTVMDNVAYVANAYNPIGGINAVDVSDPENPELLSTFGQYASYVAGHGQLVLFSGGGLGCTMLNVDDPSNPQEVYHMTLPSSVNEVFVNGNYAYTGSNGFRVFDISDKSDPVQVGYDDIPGSLVAATEDMAVFIPKSMGGNNPVNIVDISDKQNPYLRGTYTASAMTYDIDLIGNYAFIACWWDGFRVVDFSDPDTPSLAAHAFGWVNNNSVPGVDYCYVQALDIEGNYLYIVDYKPFEDTDSKGLYVFDISDPANPEFVARYANLISAGYDVDVVGDYAYVADRDGGLEVIDVSDPTAPITTGYVYLPDVGYSVDVDGSFAYVANYILGGLQVVDISNPSDPQIAGYYYRTGCFALGATVQGSYVFVGDGPAGFQVYDNMIITSVDKPEAFADQILSVYPNPAAEEINISLEAKGYCRLTITDLTGREIAVIFDGELNTGQTDFRFDRFPASGIYFLNAMIDGQNQTRKLIVNH